MAKGIIAGLTATLLLGIMAGTYFTPQQLSNAYVCNATGKIGTFDKLSSTSKTAYYTDTTGTHTASCLNKWQPLKDYLQSQRIQVTISQSASNGFYCGLDGCVPIQGGK